MSSIIHPQVYIDTSIGATTVGGTIVLHSQNGGSWHVDFNTNTGAWKIEASNDPRCDPAHNTVADIAAAKWVDITADIAPTDPAGSSGQEIIDISDIRFAYIRLTYTKSSGTGAILVYSCFKGNG